MMARALYFFVSTISDLWNWFEILLAKAGGTAPYLAAFFIFQVGRFLLGPIFGTAAGVFLGSAGSDAARHGYGRGDHSPHLKKLPGGKK